MAKKLTKRKTKEKRFEDKVEDFTEEVERIFENFGERMEDWGRRHERHYKWHERHEDWFPRTFGFVGPFISSIFSLIVFYIGLWFIDFINVYIGSGLIANLHHFLNTNVGLFFLIFIFSSYRKYFSKVHPRIYLPFAPIAAAVGLLFGVWVLFNAIYIANFYIGNELLFRISLFLENNLYTIGWFAVFVGYIVLLVRLPFLGLREIKIETMESDRMKKRAKKSRSEPSGIKRLYRSGKDKIIGGVCGGIAEYLKVDPVIIRLLWVLAALTYGSGVLLYIIAWIIMPRNPNHKWK